MLECNCITEQQQSEEVSNQLGNKKRGSVTCRCHTRDVNILPFNVGLQ
jgi:hypothetical protein